MRVYCKHCHATHAILPSGIVPYKRISLDDLIYVIQIFLDDPKSIDSYELKRIINEFKVWQTKLKDTMDLFQDDLITVVQYCADNFKQCFMQHGRRKYRRNGRIFEVVFSVLVPPT